MAPEPNLRHGSFAFSSGQLALLDLDFPFNLIGMPLTPATYNNLSTLSLVFLNDQVILDFRNCIFPNLKSLRLSEIGKPASQLSHPMTIFTLRNWSAPKLQRLVLEKLKLETNTLLQFLHLCGKDLKELYIAPADCDMHLPAIWDALRIGTSIYRRPIMPLVSFSTQIMVTLSFNTETTHEVYARIIRSLINLVCLWRLEGLQKVTMFLQVLAIEERGKEFDGFLEDMRSNIMRIHNSENDYSLQDGFTFDIKRPPPFNVDET